MCLSVLLFYYWESKLTAKSTTEAFEIVQLEIRPLTYSKSVNKRYPRGYWNTTLICNRVLCRRACMHKCTARRKGHILTFRRAAYGVVSKASSTLFEVRTGRASVSRGNGDLATPFCAANPAWRRACRPGTPWSHHTVNGCWGSRETERSAEWF